LNKLLPGGDLNDTIIENYLRTLQIQLPTHVTNTTFFFSSFFLDKLIGAFLKDDQIMERDRNEVITHVRERVRETYKNVRRWTKNQDIFAKEVLVFPINSLRHWYCLLVINPHALLKQREGKQCEIICCDSMFESREFIMEAVRM
jgi:Ulp1 family protease